MLFECAVAAVTVSRVIARCDSFLATDHVLQDEALKRMIQQAVDAKERARLEAERKALEEKLRRQEEERQRQEEARRVREEELRRDQLKREELNRQGVCPAGYVWLKVRFVLCSCHVTSHTVCYWLRLRAQKPGGGWICDGGSHERA